MTRPRVALVASTLIFGGALLVACSGDRSSAAGGGATAAGPTAATAEVSAPEGSVADVGFEHFDGTVGSFAQFAGTPVVVNFFAKWCTPCVRELPEIEEVHQRLGDQVAVVGVSSGERAEDALELVRETGVTFTVVRDPRQEAVTALGGVGMPTTVLIDATGRVLDVRTGTYQAAELEAKVREVLLS